MLDRPILGRRSNAIFFKYNNFINKFTSTINKTLKKYLSIILIIFYCLGWYLPYCCNTKIQSPIVKSIKNINKALSKFN